MKIFLALLALAALAWPAAAADGPTIHVFGSSKCHLCAEAVAYLRAVAERESTQIIWHDSDESPREAALMRAVASELKMIVDGYPFIVVGRRAHLGWKGSTTGLIITNELAQVRVAGDEDVVARLEASLDARLAQQATAPRAWSLGVAGEAALAAVFVVGLTMVALARRKQ